jgi:hypothetical protein
MGKLIAKYAEEAMHDSALRQTMDQLQNYKLPRTPFIGLERKLRLAEWEEDEIEWAMRWKETFAKRLEEITFSRAAQEIVVYVLSKVYNNFREKVRPVIVEGVLSKEHIEALTIGAVLQPVLSELEDNPLGFCMDDIWGALHFLTGNCHIKWHRG